MTDNFDKLYDRLLEIERLLTKKVEMEQKFYDAKLLRGHPVAQQAIKLCEHMDFMIEALKCGDVVMAKLSMNEGE
jgi:hypothetical protein